MPDILTLGKLRTLLAQTKMPKDTPVYILTDTLCEDAYAVTGFDIMVIVQDMEPVDVLTLRGEFSDTTLIDPTNYANLDLDD